MVLDNPKHEAFAAARAKGKSAEDAALDAGYSKARARITGAELMRRPEVSARITELSEASTAHAVKEAGIDKAWVLSQLVENVQMGKQAVPVLDGEGQPTGDYKQNLPAANRALELIGKELGMFVDRSEVTMNRYAEMSEEELQQEIARLEAEAGAG